MTVRVGIVGFGEAGAAIAAGLAEQGTPVTAYDVRFTGEAGAWMRAAADQAGVAVAEDIGSLARRSDVVLSLVTSAAALEVAGALAPHVGPDHLVADLNSTSPELVGRVFEVIRPTGAVFVDVAVMAAVPPHRHRVPMLACGPGAARLTALDLGLQVEVVAGDPGAASAVKMCRSHLIKGLEALLLEFAVAAVPLGVADRVLESMAGALPEDWGELADYLLARTARHGRRRGEELDQVAEMLRAVGVEPWLAGAGARRLRWAADQGLEARFRDRAPASYHEVVAALAQQRRRREERDGTG